VTATTSQAKRASQAVADSRDVAAKVAQIAKTSNDEAAALTTLRGAARSGTDGAA
jgi:hypothetical protein